MGYLDSNGLQYLCSKFKESFSAKGHTHDDRYYTESEVNTKLNGKVDNNETGANSLLSKLNISWTANPTDDTYFVRQDTGGGNSFGRVKFSTLWNYIKSKADSVYSKLGHTHDDRYYTESEIDTKLKGKADTHSHPYLPTAGGTMGGAAKISWPDSGNLSNSNKNVTFPVKRGGLSWAGQSDGVELYAEETGNDNLDLVLKFTDDNSNSLRIVNSSGNTTAKITATGTFTGKANTAGTADIANSVDWSKVQNKPSTYPASSHTHNDKLSLSGGVMTGDISYKGSKNTYAMIKFIDNKADEYGNGIAIGGGGATIIGGGESSDIVKSLLTSGGDEKLILSNDGAIDIYTNCQSGINTATHVTIGTDGSYSGKAAKAGTADVANSVEWNNVKNKPSTYTPSGHNHDDRYYTETEMNSKLSAKAESVVLASNANLNNIVTPGIYSCGGGNSITNKPSGLDAIGLIVVHNATGGYYTQILTNSTNANTYRRTCLNGTWSAWTVDKYTDTNTWRGIQNNLTSDSTSDSLSAAQGKTLKGLVDGKENKGVCLPLSGGTVSGRIVRNGGGQWIADRDQVAVFNSTKPDSGNYRPVVGQKTVSGAWTIGAYTSEDLIFDYTTDTDYNAKKNASINVKLPAQSGTIITSATIGSQSVSKASTATKATSADSATTASKLSTSAGSSTQPVYFKDGVPVATSYTLAKSVPSDAKFTDTNTWRGVQNNLTSEATDQSLSAAQGKILNNLTFQKRESIGNTTDWNTLVNPGCYKFQGGSWGDVTKYHGPNEANSNIYAFGLILVFKATDSDTEKRTVQIYLPHNSNGTVYTRMLNGSTWNKWAPIYKGVSWGEISSKPSSFTPSSHTHTKSQITDFPTSMPASDVKAWAKADTKPGYTKSEVGLGNVDNTADSTKSVKYAASAGVADMPSGFKKKPTAQTWGNQTGTFITGWDDDTGGSIAFRKDNPAAGKMSMIIDGYVYQNEGKNMVLDAVNYSDYAAKKDHTHKSVIDSGNNSSSTTFAYSKAGMNYSDYTWLAGWNGYELRAINKNQFAKADHTHRVAAFVGSDTANTNGWYKFATQTMSGYGDSNVILAVTSTYGEYNNGIFVIQLRSNNTSVSIVKFGWLVRQGFAVGDIIAVVNGMTATYYVKKNVSQYGRIGIEILSQSSINNRWSNISLANNSTKEATNPTATVTATDIGTVSYANNANYSNSAGAVAWGNVSGKPSTFTPSSHTHNYAGSGSAGGSANSAVKLDTATAGSATQPVYFTGGKPTACTYTLGKSVPSNAVFTDTNNKVTQTAVKSSNYTNWRPLVWGSSNSATEGFSPATVTDGTFTADSITCQPSSGTIRATTFKGKASSAGAADYSNGLRLLQSTRPTSMNFNLGSDDFTKKITYSIASSSTTEGKPPTNAVVMNCAWDSNGYGSQIAIGAQSAPRMYLRGATNNNGASKWDTAWKTIAFTDDKPSTAGTADMAKKLSVNDGSATQPIYFKDGVPTACSYALNKTVPADAKFTDTNTWRGIQDNLTSDSASDSLSAKQGKVLKGLVDGKAASGHNHNIENLTNFWARVYDASASRTAATVLAAPASSNGAASFRKLAASDLPSHTHSYLPLSGGTVTGVTSFTNTTASTSKSTGAVKVSGGVGVAGRMSANEVMIGDGCTLQFDSTNKCVNFIFS